MAYNLIKPETGGGAWYREVNPTASLPTSAHIPTGGWRGMRGYGAVPSHSYPESSVIPGYWQGLGSVGSTMFGQDAKTTGATPVINGISVGKGPTTGGTQFELYGSGFQPGAQVYFAMGATMAPATVLSVVSNKITGKTPKVATMGAANIIVQNSAGGSVTMANGFTFTQVQSFWDQMASGLTQMTRAGTQAYADIKASERGVAPPADLSAPPPPGTPTGPINIAVPASAQYAPGAKKPMPWGMIAIGGAVVLGGAYFLFNR
jgi:hypothetical protein